MKAHLSSKARAHAAFLVLTALLLGCGERQLADSPDLKVDRPVSNKSKREISTISLGESTVMLDDHELESSDGLRQLADYLGPPDRSSSKQSEETWIWDRNGVAATGTTDLIDSIVVAFDPTGLRRGSPRGVFQGKVIVQGRGDLSDVTIDSASDQDIVSEARRVHRGFGSTHDAATGSIIDIQAGFIAAEEASRLNESPLLRSKYSGKQVPAPAVGPASNGESSPPAR